MIRYIGSRAERPWFWTGLAGLAGLTERLREDLGERSVAMRDMGLFMSMDHDNLNTIYPSVR